MIKPLLRIGHRILQQTAKPVTAFDTLALHQLIIDLKDTMKANGAVGIAAPQIGVSLQVIVFGFDKSPRYPDALPIAETVLINPTYTVIDDQIETGWEGCLSVKAFRGLVPRALHIEYQGYDVDGQLLQRTVSHFHARVVQHEIDHLNGILFLERIKNFKYFGYEDDIDELQQLKQSVN